MNRDDPLRTAIVDLDDADLRSGLIAAKYAALDAESPRLRALFLAFGAHLNAELRRRARVTALFALDLDDGDSAGELVADLDTAVEAARREFFGLTEDPPRPPEPSL